MALLTPEQITEGYINPTLTIINFGLAQADNETKDLVIAQLKETVAKLEANNDAIEIEDVIDAAFVIAETSVELTPTEKDDKVIAALKAVKDLLFGKAGLLKVLLGLSKAQKALKKG